MNRENKTRNIREVKVGDKKVNVISIEILNYVLDEIYKRLDKLEKVEAVGVDDSEEVEFTKQELSTIYYAMKEVGENFPSGNENEKYLNTIISKLNKMLKEKE